MRAHSDTYAQGCKSIRIGASVPPSDVNLVYYYTGAIGPDECLEIRDIASSWFGLEEGSRSAPALMVSDIDGLLRKMDAGTGAMGDPYILYRHLALTDMFKAEDLFEGKCTPETALYYKYRLARRYAGRYGVWEIATQTPAGVYSGRDIQITTTSGEEIPPDLYEIWAVAIEQYPWTYDVTVYFKHWPGIHDGVVIHYTPAVELSDGTCARGPVVHEVASPSSVFAPGGESIVVDPGIRSLYDGFRLIAKAAMADAYTRRDYLAFLQAIAVLYYVNIFFPVFPVRKQYTLVDDGSGRGYKVVVPEYGMIPAYSGVKFRWRVRGTSSLGWELKSAVFASSVLASEGTKVLSDMSCLEILVKEYPGVTFTSASPELVSSDGVVTVSQDSSGRPCASTSESSGSLASDLVDGPGIGHVNLPQAYTLTVTPYLCKNWEDFTWRAVGTGQRVNLPATHGVGMGNGLWKRWANGSPLEPVCDYSLGHSGKQYLFNYNWDVTTTLETRVFVPKNVTVSFPVGNNDKITVYVNGTKQYECGATCSWFLGYSYWENTCKLTFRAGWNTVRVVVTESGFWDNCTWAYTIGAFHGHLEAALGAGVPYAINDVAVPLEPYVHTATGTARCSLYPKQDAQIQAAASLPLGVINFRWQTISTDSSRVVIEPAQDFAMAGSAVASLKDVSVSVVGRPVVFSGNVMPSSGVVYVSEIGTLPQAAGVRPGDFTAEERDKIFYTLKASGDGINARYLMPSGSYSTCWFGPYMGTSAVTQTQCASTPSAKIAVWASYASAGLSTVFAIRPIETDLDLVGRSTVVDRAENWYIEVADFSYARTLVLPAPGAPLYTLRPELAPYAGKTAVLLYVLPEYASQPFSPYMPIRRITERPAIADETTMSVSRPIYLPESDSSDRYASIEVSCGRVMSVEPGKGLIHLDRPISPGSSPLVSYYGEVYSYRYRGYRDPGGFVHLDLNPGPYHTLVIDEDGVVPGHIRAMEALIERPVRDLLGREFLVYAVPYSVSVDGVVVSGATRDRVLYHTTLSFDEIAALDPTVLPLATVSVELPISPRSVVLIDTRSRGGGLREDITSAIIAKICPEARFYWDIGHWDGSAYKESGVLIVELPKTVLKTFGGRFTEDEVMAVVEQYLACGIMAQVRYY